MKQNKFVYYMYEMCKSLIIRYIFFQKRLFNEDEY